MNARRSPGWVLGNHTEDQVPQFFARRPSSNSLPSPREPSQNST
jgi:hypothetical protein